MSMESVPAANTVTGRRPEKISERSEGAPQSSRRKAGRSTMCDIGSSGQQEALRGRSPATRTNEESHPTGVAFEERCG